MREIIAQLLRMRLLLALAVAVVLAVPLLGSGFSGVAILAVLGGAAVVVALTVAAVAFLTPRRRRDR